MTKARRAAKKTKKAARLAAAQTTQAAEKAKAKRSRAAKLGWKRRVAASPALQTKRRSKAAKLGWKRRKQRAKDAVIVVGQGSGYWGRYALYKDWEDFTDLTVLQDAAYSHWRGVNVVGWAWSAKLQIEDDDGNEMDIKTISVPFNDSPVRAKDEFKQYLEDVLKRGAYGGNVSILNTAIHGKVKRVKP